MGESFRFLPELGLVHVRITEPLNLGLLRRLAFQAHLAVRSSHVDGGGLGSLLDLRGSTLAPGEELVEDAAHLQERLGDHYPFQRRAIVVDDGVLSAACLRFVEVTTDTAIQSRVFDTLEEALVWLGLSPELAKRAPFSDGTGEDEPCR